jgi:hypothetical protein
MVLAVGQSVAPSQAVGAGAAQLLGTGFTVGAACVYGAGSLLAEGESVATAVGGSSAFSVGRMLTTADAFAVGAAAGAGVATMLVTIDRATTAVGASQAAAVALAQLRGVGLAQAISYGCFVDASFAPTRYEGVHRIVVEATPKDIIVAATPFVLPVPDDEHELPISLE